jgi:hypothetical protein
VSFFIGGDGGMPFMYTTPSFPLDGCIIDIFFLGVKIPNYVAA